MALRHEYIEINGIRMHYVTAGSGPPLLLLHGFPEFWYSWRHQIPALAEHFTVIAPDQRGYNETDKPNWGYEIDVLVHDAVELLRALGHEQASVVGHDWGGAVAWATAIAYPQHVERLAVLNMPHPALAQQSFRSNPAQILRSSYIFLFQTPWLPEAILSANDYAAIEQAFRGMAINKAAFTDADIRAYKDAASKPGALTAMLNWYRALGRTRRLTVQAEQFDVTVPTLLIWGENDSALGKELTYGTDKYVPDLRLHYIANSSHWVQHEYPDEVSRLLLDFFVPQLNERTATQSA